MRDLLVATLISLAKSHPYLLGASALSGSSWFVRSLIHKARLVTQHLTKEVRGGKAELGEWGNDLAELWRELTTRKVDP
jgi:hypothetical protein